MFLSGHVHRFLIYLLIWGQVGDQPVSQSLGSVREAAVEMSQTPVPLCTGKNKRVTMPPLQKEARVYIYIYIYMYIWACIHVEPYACALNIQIMAHMV